VKPYGRVPIPSFLGPCWLVRKRCRNSWDGDYLYYIFNWCDEHRIWDSHCIGTDSPEEILIGGNIEDCDTHHDCLGEHGPIARIFWGFYNFGAAPDAIQKIFTRFNRVRDSRIRTAPPEHLRRIPVMDDLHLEATKEQSNAA